MTRRGIATAPRRYMVSHSVHQLRRRLNYQQKYRAEPTQATGVGAQVNHKSRHAGFTVLRPLKRMLPVIIKNRNWSGQKD